MDLANERIARAGFSERIRVHFMDYRRIKDHKDWKGAFDRFVSVEMMEHVGKDFLKEYWSVVDYALKPCTGTGVVQVISLPEARESCSCSSIFRSV